MGSIKGGEFAEQLLASHNGLCPLQLFHWLISYIQQSIHPSIYIHTYSMHP